MNEILSNAFKHAPEHSNIYLSAHSENNSVIICVRDEGPGIAEEQHDRLFNRFFRADDARARKEGEGAGLGLAICKRIVDAHDGKIWLKSQLGEGASFYVQLPLSGADPSHQHRLNHVLLDDEHS